MGWLEQYSEGFKLRQERRRTLPKWFALAHMAIFIFALVSPILLYVRFIAGLHGYLHGGAALNSASVAAQRMMFIPIFFGTLGPCLAIANFLEWAIRPMRDTWNRHFEGVPGASLADALRATYWLLGVTTLCLVVSVVGAFDPWQR